MKIDFNGMLFALSYALDCVEHDLIGVTTNHGKRVAALAISVGEKINVCTSLEDRQILSACAVMHDCALSEYVQDEFEGSYIAANNDVSVDLGTHCIMGEESMKLMPFDYKKAAGAVLYHHENADGSGPFGKKSSEIPMMAKLIQIADHMDARFDFSWLDESKCNKAEQYLIDESGILFDPLEVEAFLSILEETDLHSFRNEKIDLYMHQLLPGGQINITPDELIKFAAVFAKIVDYKSHFTKTHSIGIAQKAYEMALYYGTDQEFAASMYFAGALHDIGKLVVDRDILEKPDKLSSTEYRHIQTHAYYTYKILSDVPGIPEITKWASHHHEKLDGSGYPYGLTGIELGRWERLMACLDIYQALTEERPYKKGMTHTRAIGILNNMGEKGQLDQGIIHDLDVYYGGKNIA